MFHKRTYNKYKSKAFNEIPIEPNNKKGLTDRSLMNNFLKPFKQDLLSHGINEPHHFSEIFKRHKIKRGPLQILIKEIEKHLQLKEIITSIRELNHSNSYEKNILLTYQALHDPNGMYIVLYNYISANFLDIENKKQLFSDLENEIKSVHSQISKSINVLPINGEKVISPSSNCSTVLAIESVSPYTTICDQDIEVISEHVDDNDYFSGSSGSFDDTYDDFCNSNLEDDFIF